MARTVADQELIKKLRKKLPLLNDSQKKELFDKMFSPLIENVGVALSLSGDEEKRFKEVFFDFLVNGRVSGRLFMEAFGSSKKMWAVLNFFYDEDEISYEEIQAISIWNKLKGTYKIHFVDNLRQFLFYWKKKAYLNEGVKVKKLFSETGYYDFLKFRSMLESLKSDGDLSLKPALLNAISGLVLVKALGEENLKSFLHLPKQVIVLLNLDVVNFSEIKKTKPEKFFKKVITVLSKMEKITAPPLFVKRKVEMAMVESFVKNREKTELEAKNEKSEKLIEGGQP
jgi:hypothetical protein